MAPALFTATPVVVSLRPILEFGLVGWRWGRFWLEGPEFRDVGLWFEHGENRDQGLFQNISGIFWICHTVSVIQTMSTSEKGNMDLWGFCRATRAQRDKKVVSLARLTLRHLSVWLRKNVLKTSITILKAGRRKSLMSFSSLTN